MNANKRKSARLLRESNNISAVKLINSFISDSCANLSLVLSDVQRKGRKGHIIIIRQGLVNHALVADPEINVSAMLCELAAINRK